MKQCCSMTYGSTINGAVAEFCPTCGRQFSYLNFDDLNKNSFYEELIELSKPIYFKKTAYDPFRRFAVYLKIEVINLIAYSSEIVVDYVSTKVTFDADNTTTAFTLEEKSKDKSIPSGLFTEMPTPKVLLEEFNKKILLPFYEPTTSEDFSEVFFKAELMAAQTKDLIKDLA